MSKLMTSTLLALLFVSTYAMAQNGATSKKDIHKNIDNYIGEMMQLHQIPGLALAVLKDGEIVHKGFYGKASLEHNIPVHENTIFRVYSTTKLITTTAIFQLIEMGKISLDDELSIYFEDLPEEWKGVQIKNLLTHSSGLPDHIFYPVDLSDEELFSKLFDAEMDFRTGNQFKYNQTNYWLLALIIEKISGRSFHDFIKQMQFSSSGDKVLFSSNALEVIPNRIGKYNYNKNLKNYEIATDNVGVRGYSGNGLNITLEEFINWSNNLTNGHYLNEETKSLMWSPFNYINGKDKFLHGWGIYPINEKKSYGFSGGGVSGFRIFPEEDITVVVLSNGYKYYPVQDVIINHVGGIVEEGLIDRSKVIEQEIITGFFHNVNEDVVKLYNRIIMENPTLDLEDLFNSIGYKLLAMDQVVKAIEIFELNVAKNPESSNAYDSLAEAYLYIDQFELAIKNYKKSLDLNPENTNAAEMIKKIEQRMVELTNDKIENK